MKKYILPFIWALLCAWVTTWCLAKLNTKVEFTEWLFIPSVIDFLHAHSWSAKTVLWYSITLFYLITKIHEKLFTLPLFFLIGLCVISLIAVLIVGFGALLWPVLVGLLP